MGIYYYGDGYQGGAALGRGSEYAQLDQSMAVVFVFLALMMVLFAIVLVNYLLKGFGMYGMAKKLGVANPWLAFIPIASNYLQGELAGEFSVGSKQVKNPGFWMLLVPIIGAVIMYVFYFIWFIALMIATTVMGNETAFAGWFIFLFLIFFLVVLTITVAIQLVQGLIRYEIYKRYVDGAWAVIHMLLGFSIPLYQSIYFFVLRKRYPIGMEPPPQQPQQPVMPPFVQGPSDAPEQL